MEIESGDGSKTQLIPGSITPFGRGAGFTDDGDRTVSRRQILFQLHPSSDHEPNCPRVHFEVVGKNPVWVHSSKTGGLKTYRSSERGEMEVGDTFCVSAKKPVWFTLKTIDLDAEGRVDTTRDSLIDSELADSLGSSHGQLGVEELELDSINLSAIDPVKEFGLVVMGHEFDCYPKKLIQDFKNWDWDIVELRDESEYDEGRVRKRKKVGKNDDDDEWTGESEGEKEVITKSRKSQRPKYMTRTKDCGKPSKGVGKEKPSAQRKKNTHDEEELDDDESDETLGGFIVEDEELEEDEDDGGEEEEEEFEEAVDEEDSED